MAVLLQGDFRRNQAGSFNPNLININAQTADLTIRVARPTTGGVVDWPEATRLSVAIIIAVDGVEYRSSFSASGGIRLDSHGVEQAFFSCVWSLPVGFFNTEAVPEEEWPNLRAKRIGETAASSFQGTIEVSWDGSIDTTYEFSSETLEAPQDWRYHSSIAYQNATAASEDGGDGTVSVSFDAGAGSNRAALVVAGSDGSQPTSHAVTYGGAGPSITRPWNATDEIFSRCTGDVFIDSEIGSGAKTVQSVVTGAVSGGTTIAVVTMTGVDQTVPVGTAATAAGTSGTTASVTVGSVNSTDLVVDGLYVWDTAVTIGADQTERASAVAGSNLTKMSTQLGTAGGVMSWTGIGGEWSYGAVAFKAFIDPTAAITGTATASINETDIVAGGKTVIITLTDATFKPAAGTPAFSTGTTKGTTGAPGRTGNGDLTISFPTAYTPVAGDFALIILYHDQGTGTTPTDWSQVTGSPFGSGTPKLQVFYKVFVGGESAPVSTISGSGVNVSHCANMAIYTGIGSIGAVGTASDGTGTPMTAGAINTTADNSIVIAASGRGDNENSSGQTFNGSTTGVNERLDGGTSEGNDSQVSMADISVATSGSSSGNASSTTSATDPWVSVQIELKPSTPFNDARQAIINGLDSAQAEGTGWDAVVKAGLAVTTVVRTSDTVVTITLSAFGSYNITAQEIITVTVPAAALVSGGPLTGTPTFTIDPGEQAAAVKGIVRQQAVMRAANF